jgi:carboxymethylenebutenolidase
MATVEIRTADGVADAYLSLPAGGGRHPGVLFVMDAYGLRPRIEAMADRIAAEGYAVLAPNVFYRAGRTPVLPMPDLADAEARSAFFGAARKLMAELTPERLAGDGAAYLGALAEHGGGDGAAGVTGYCMGARMGLRIAAAHPGRVAALAGFHAGGLVTDDPASPHRAVGALRAEVYMGHADNDGSNTPEQIAAFDAALAGAGLTFRTEVYAGAAHGYTMADTPAWDEAACERHFAALFELLGRTI